MSDVATTAQPVDPAGTSRSRRVIEAVDTRLGLDALRYPVPEHANNLAWSLGGLTAVTLALLIATGVLLSQFYSPTPEVANASVRHLVEDVFLGRFIRSLHFWAAQAMYVLAAMHLVRVFFHGSYKRPREANWLIGVSMFGLTVLGIFTGTALKWDQEAYEAVAHNLEVTALLGGAGFWFSSGFADQTPILVRIYAAHVMLIPGLLLTLVTVHALLIKKHRISAHPAIPYPEKSEPFTRHLRRLGSFGLVLVSGLTVLAVLFPPAVGPTPVAGIEVTRPMWIFWWLFTLENWVGLAGILWGAGVLFALLFALPFIDRNPSRSWRTRPVAMAVGSVVLLTIVVLTVLMAFTSPAEHLGM